MNLYGRNSVKSGGAQYVLTEGLKTLMSAFDDEMPDKRQPRWPGRALASIRAELEEVEAAIDSGSEEARASGRLAIACVMNLLIEIDCHFGKPA